MKIITWELLQSYCYVPYSGISEFCMIRGKSGVHYPGVRVENISFPLSTNAVQNAIFSCISEGDIPELLLLPEPEITATEHGSHQQTRASGKRAPVPENALHYWCEQFKISREVVSSAGLPDTDHTFRTSEPEPGLDRLKELTSRCKIPHSNFPVTALLQTDAGTFSGVNIEDPDWQKGLCAERVAMCKAIAAGANSFFEMHVYAPKSDFVSPCGACRQFLSEHMNNGTIQLYHNDSESTRFNVSALLPYQFVASDLKKT